MCADPIISKDRIREKARVAFQAGLGRDDHHMNPGSPAIETWQEEWDRLAAKEQEKVAA
ncbi:hypothetical protein [Massilia sp. TS11]|uniref:hypothetical protein n=1 Tax=Massilia sp. TS11 TaxID=2908003 RepID=UPI001EDA31A6|nr:hypothetical protein [Massilia sp. TS11]MCG2586520.1 hypothetical protein [Massilia sp. TS11]